MKIRVLITGGTIDGVDKKSYPAEEKYTLVPDLLKKIGGDYVVDVLMIKDSSFITDEDRQLIASRCRDCEENNILITHGTNTMAATARFLNKQNLDKTIVLTGAFIPADQEQGDAQDNIEKALEAARSLPRGVYIAMNNQIFGADNVRKNFEKKIFEKETP